MGPSQFNPMLEALPEHNATPHPLNTSYKAEQIRAGRNGTIKRLKFLFGSTEFRFY